MTLSATVPKNQALGSDTTHKGSQQYTQVIRSTVVFGSTPPCWPPAKMTNSTNPGHDGRCLDAMLSESYSRFVSSDRCGLNAVYPLCLPSAVLVDG